MNNGWWLVPVLLPVLASAQQDSTWAPSTTENHRFRIEASGAYDSNVLYNDLITGLYRGGFLSTQIRQRSMDALGTSNRAGYELGARATYAWGDSLLGHARWMPRFSLAFQSTMGMRFSSDAYALSLFGNRDFEDRTAHIGPGKLMQLAYQSFGFGVEDRSTGSFVELSVVNGSALNALDLTLADLYTAPDGRYLDLRIAGKYQRSDTATAINNGFGAAISAAWQHRIQLFGAPAVFSLGITDIGFIAWNGNALSVTKDSTLRYEGINVDGILDLDGALVNRSTLQDSLGFGYSTGQFTTALPGKVQARAEFGRMHRKPMDKVLCAYELAVDYRYLPGYVPRTAITRNLAINKCLVAEVGAGYGGFGEIRATGGLQARIGNRARFGIRTPNAIGLVSEAARGRALAFWLEAVW